MIAVAAGSQNDGVARNDLHWHHSWYSDSALLCQPFSVFRWTLRFPFVSLQQLPRTRGRLTCWRVLFVRLCLCTAVPRFGHSMVATTAFSSGCVVSLLVPPCSFLRAVHLPLCAKLLAVGGQGAILFAASEYGVW